MSDELNSIFFFPNPAPINIGYITDEGVVFEKVYGRQKNSLVQVSFTKGLWPEPLLDILTDDDLLYVFWMLKTTSPITVGIAG